MNFKELEYILMIEEEKNVTKAAHRLFVTPSALNQHLHKLENEIGTPLFSKTDDGWIPTEAGEVYLDASKKILNIKKNAYNLITDISNAKDINLTIGIPPERGSDMFTSIYPIFHKEFPKVTINLIERSVTAQQELLNKGVIDISFITIMDSQKTNNTYIHLKDEELFIVLSKENLKCNHSTVIDDSPFPYLDLALLKDEEFAIMNKTSTFREVVDKILASEKIVPNILFETSRVSTIINVVSSNLCCGIVHESALIYDTSNVNLFCMKSRPKWQIYATYKKGYHLTKPAKRFIELAKEYFDQDKLSQH